MGWSAGGGPWQEQKSLVKGRLEGHTRTDTTNSLFRPLGTHVRDLCRGGRKAANKPKGGNYPHSLQQAGLQEHSPPPAQQPLTALQPHPVSWGPPRATRLSQNRGLQGPPHLSAVARAGHPEGMAETDTVTHPGRTQSKHVGEGLGPPRSQRRGRLVGQGPRLCPTRGPQLLPSLLSVPLPPSTLWGQCVHLLARAATGGTLWARVGGPWGLVLDCRHWAGGHPQSTEHKGLGTVCVCVGGGGRGTKSELIFTRSLGGNTESFN